MKMEIVFYYYHFNTNSTRDSFWESEHRLPPMLLGILCMTKDSRMQNKLYLLYSQKIYE